MIKENLIEKKRSSYDIGLMGLKNCGKTTVMSYILFQYALKKAVIMSNFDINLPFIKINSIDDLDCLYDFDKDVLKVVAIDDIEYYFSSKFTKKDISNRINDIILFLGKINCNLIYSVKRSMGVLIDIRESSTNEFWFPQIIRKVYCDNQSYDNIIDRFMNYKKIVISRFDNELNELPSIEINGIENIVPIFNTQEIIKPLKG